MNEELATMLRTLAEHPLRDELLHRLTLRYLKMRLQELIDQLAGKRLDFVLILGDDETGDATSASNMDQETSDELVRAWLKANRK